MDLNEALKQHYAGINEEQMRLKRMYDAQQTEIGKAGIEAQRKLSEKLKRAGINAPGQEVGAMINAQTGEKYYYMKG